MKIYFKKLRTLSLPLFLFIGMSFFASTASAATLRRPPNNLGLVAYWSMNEGTSTQVGDFSGNGHTGTFAGALSPSWVDGKLGKATSFQYGSNNRVTFANITTGTTHTVSMWIYLTHDCGNYGSLIDNDGANGLYCMTDGTGNKIDYWFNVSPSDHFSNTILGLNRWYHVVVVNNAGTATFYINGVADGTVAVSAPSYNANTIGGDTLFEGLGGKIDEVRLYNRALSATEITNLYRSSFVKINSSRNNIPGSTLQTGLVGLWSFNGPDMSGVTAYDRSGSGNNGTLTNGPTPSIGKVGQGLTFNGTNSYVDLGNVAAFKPTGNFSASFWYKGLKGSTETFLSHSPSVLTNFWYIDNLQAFFCGTGSCGTSVAKAYTLPSDNGWHNLTAVLDRGPNPDTLTVYIDGVSQGTASDTADGGASFGSNTWIGGPSWNNTGYRQGPMDEVRLYNRALSAAEAKQLYLIGR